MTTTSIGTRLMAANSSSEFEAAATTCRPRSLRRASAKSWVCMRVPSATTILTKSVPTDSWDDIESPDVIYFAKRTGEGIKKQFVLKEIWTRGGVVTRNTDQSFAVAENVTLTPRIDKPGFCTLCKKMHCSRGLVS